VRSISGEIHITVSLWCNCAAGGSTSVRPGSGIMKTADLHGHVEMLLLLLSDFSMGKTRLRFSHRALVVKSVAILGLYS
jgi:hypothetical protein